jgi:hypothetical protein
MHPLVAEAMKKAAVAWLEVEGHDPYAVWCAWADGGLTVVSGPGEQPAPGLADAERAVVIARGDHGGAIVAWRAVVSRVDPASAQWPELVPALAAKRLNSEPAAPLAERWAQSNVVSRLVPADDEALTPRTAERRSAPTRSAPRTRSL